MPYNRISAVSTFSACDLNLRLQGSLCANIFLVCSIAESVLNLGFSISYVVSLDKISAVSTFGNRDFNTKVAGGHYV